MISTEYLYLILGCFVVTWIPRILPFAFAKKMNFPAKFRLFLDYLPLCILSALLVQNLLSVSTGRLPMLNISETLACIPALIVGIYTKDLMKIVVTGIIAIALIRLFI
ncbi:branched-chain amino acid ABC transporter [Tetragenococcus osmophilus]|uniref:Branched-chain amino acid ABC transporter n=1 Tax=Tetragenococcus osmophilus TaxID=526944 RepID=A0AA37XK00_9ENTE|nr:AzlD domain-containing protein [Tetragenococcus osmophilus]AYW48313.1 branched-chain amino acid ABC transporter [Tetragenococcus osmophilus]GMA54122.1 branched-chain amino acid ABC transporter [Alicyclobacillus contaminans]GMA71992.1 branched-chain amino acid ABC transporter [Tetragenococcus osmophilus]